MLIDISVELRGLERTIDVKEVSIRASDDVEQDQERFLERCIEAFAGLDLCHLRLQGVCFDDLFIVPAPKKRSDACDMKCSSLGAQSGHVVLA